MKSIIFSILLGASNIFLIPPYATADPQRRVPATVKLSRTACLGSCPIYSVEISSDGRVSYSGKKFVRVKGKTHANIEPSKVQELLDEFRRINFFGLKDSYITKADGSVAMDLPSTYVYLKQDGIAKEVLDYFGGPDELRALETKIDIVAGTQKWVFIDAATVRSLAKHGWNAKQNGHLYLDEAVRWQDVQLVEALLQHGADPNAQAKDGSLPLVSAAGIGEEPIFDLLVAHGANVNSVGQSGKGETPLASAAKWGKVRIVERLLLLGADVNGVDEDNSTALMAAAEHGEKQILVRLLAAGANPNITSSYGHFTARTWLQSKYALRPPNVDELIAILKEAEQNYRPH